MKHLTLAVLLMLAASPAHAITADDASAKCATAIDDKLRDPASADYLFSQRIVAPGKTADSFTVILPVRAQNAFGSYVTQTFVCAIKAGRVVEVAK